MSRCASVSLPLLFGFVVLVGLLLGLTGLANSWTQTETKKAKSNQVTYHEQLSAADAAPPGHIAPSMQVPRSNPLRVPTLCGPSPWSTSTTGPSARYRAGGVTDGTYVYVFGGGDPFGGYLNDLWRWDPSSETWTQLTNMPTGKQNIQGAYWNGKIYVPGGYIGFHIVENAIYDIATNTWATGAPLPATHTGQNVAFNNKIYNFGGNPGPQSTTLIYDIAANSWSTGAPMPVATTYGRAVVAGSYAYYVGGIAGNTTNAVYRYDFAADSWATMASLHTARTSEELVTSPDASKLFAVMGGDADFFTGVPRPQSVEIYDIAANSWSYGNPVVTKAAAPAGGLVGNKAMVQGGTDDIAYYDTVQVSVIPDPPCPTPPPTPTPIAQYAVTTSTGASIVPGTVDIGNHCDDCTTPISLPFPFQFYDQVFTTADVNSNGLLQFMGGNASLNGCLPANFTPYIIAPHWSDLYTSDTASGQGIFTSISGAAPNRIFNIEWRATYCCSSGPPTENFEIRLYESESRIEIIYGSPGQGGIGVQHDICQYTAVSCGAVVAAGTQYTFTEESNSQPPTPDYLVTTSTGASIVPGTIDIGNHCDDCTTQISFPFPVLFYDQVFSSANVSSNGFLQFTGNNNGCCGSCLPQDSVSNLIAPHWSDLYTSDTASGQGIFTSVSGTAPNRIFNIEWRATYCCSGGAPTENFEVRLHENKNRIDMIYGSPGQGGIGVQRGTDPCHFTAVSCGVPPPAGTQYTFVPSFPTVIGAVSRKTHASIVDFDVDLPFGGPPGIESRSGGGTNDYTIVVTFSGDVGVNGSPQAQVMSGAAIVGSGGVSNGGTVTIKGNTVIIPLTLVEDQQTIAVMVNGVGNPSLVDAPAINISVRMSRLLGDTNGNGTVNASDVSMTKGHLGRPLSTSNFRSDVNLTGTISASDVSIIKSSLGHSVP